MAWFTTIKTIKGHPYVYRQRSRREGKKVRTENQYVGPAGDAGGSSSVRERTWQRKWQRTYPLDEEIERLGRGLKINENERQLLVDLFDVGNRWQDWEASWDMSIGYNPEQVSFTPREDVLGLAEELGLPIVSQTFQAKKGSAVSDLEGAMYFHDHEENLNARIQMPAAWCFVENEGVSAEDGYHLAFLHELSHSIIHDDGGKLEADWFEFENDPYAFEEVVVEAAANLAALRLGIGNEHSRHRSSVYVQGWFTKFAYGDNAEEVVTDAILEAVGIADFIMELHADRAAAGTAT